MGFLATRKRVERTEAHCLQPERPPLQKNASLTLPAMIGQYEHKEELRTKKGCREKPHASPTRPGQAEGGRCKSELLTARS
jgi:hypothetical protein